MQNTQSIYISQEDIDNAQPVSPYKVVFSPKDIKVIEIMEKRHFSRLFSEVSDEQRIKNLEYELFGRIWEYTPQVDRINKLKLASSQVMLQGTALPYHLSTKTNVKRMMNDSSSLRERDNVGLLDGFLRLLNPELYEQYRKHSDYMFYKYDKY